MGKCSHFPQTQTFVLLLSYLMRGEQREISHLETTSFTSRLLQEDGKVLQTGEKLHRGWTGEISPQIGKIKLGGYLHLEPNLLRVISCVK